MTAQSPHASRPCLFALAIGSILAVAMPGDADATGFFTGPVSRIYYDGVTDDLLSAGLGREGLAGAAPGVADPEAPTVAELRRLAIYNNYRALVDITESGGYGRLYGPNIGADGQDLGDDDLIAGVEYIAFAGPIRRRGNEPARNVTMMVQIPDSFDPSAPCIITAASSGSRGVYGAIATSGEWGLKNGCAVAYTDKGNGTGAHNLERDTVGLIDGTRVPTHEAGTLSTFTALSDPARRRFIEDFPDRVAFKHAHSQRNPEADWGLNTLDAVRFAFEVLNDEYPQAQLTPENTIVIASSISNGGGAAVLAAEQDETGLIDAVVTSEPNVNPVFDPSFVIQQGDAEPLIEHSRSLNEYYSVLNVYLGCASASPALIGAPFNFAASPERCASLAALGLIGGATLEEQAAEAQAIINDFGFLPEQNILAPSHWFFNIPQAIGVTYGNAYARVSVEDGVCGFSFAATDPLTGLVQPYASAVEAVMFGTSNGIPPTSGLSLVADEAQNGPIQDRLAISASTGRADQNLDGYLCLASLATGEDPVTGHGVRGTNRTRFRRIERSIEAIRANGDLGGRPALFVTGRADAILPPNHTSRAYFGLNRLREGDESGLSYVEILNTQHLDVLNGFPGFDALYLPLHHYFLQGLDLMLAHLREGAPLPESQVLRTTVRQVVDGVLQPVTVEDNLPEIPISPAEGDRITFGDGVLFIPD